MPIVDSAVDPDRAELLAVIDEEIHRLPERYRIPLVLCHLEGLHHHEVAQRLGCPVGTVESRLSRAREQLRGRLVRRGLAPASAVLAAILAPSEASAAPAPLVLATLRAAEDVGPLGFGSRLALLASLLKLKSWGAAWPYRLALVPTVVVCAGAIAWVGGHRPVTEGAPPRPATVDAPQVDTRLIPVAARLQTEERPQPEPLRFPSAIATPLTRMRIDGKLGDWPEGMARYPISNRLRGHPSYSTAPRPEDADEPAYFMAGYGRDTGLIYLAVVVPDDRLIVGNKDCLGTDAVEIYVDGTYSDRRIQEPNGNWLDTLKAEKMPALQYVAIPGQGPAYADRYGANPSLVYGDIRKTSTEMAYSRTTGMTVYEWAVQAFDRYPDEPTTLVPRQRIGLEIAIVDKDRILGSPAWTSWGASPRIFKGCDSGSLGELILAERP